MRERKCVSVRVSVCECERECVCECVSEIVCVSARVFVVTYWLFVMLIPSKPNTYLT